MPIGNIIIKLTSNLLKLKLSESLQDRTSVTYIYFFEKVKKYTQKEPKMIFSDRLAAQLSACEIVFPDFKIVFCRVHLRRDLLIYFDENVNNIVGFDDILFNVNRCDEYIALFRKKLLGWKKKYLCCVNHFLLVMIF